MKFREKILSKLHREHQGIVKTKNLARGCVWWSYIDNGNESFIKKISMCQKHKSNVPKITGYKWIYPSAPIECIHIDYAGPFKNYYSLMHLVNGRRCIE